MSFFGMGRPQPSSEEKIGMMENEIVAMSDLHNRFGSPFFFLSPWVSLIAAVPAFLDIRTPAAFAPDENRPAQNE